MCNFISVNNFKFRFFPPPPVFWYIFQKSIRTFKKLKLNYIKTDTIPIYFSKNNSVYSSNFIGIRTCANTSNGRNRNVQDCWQFTAATIIDAYPIRYVIGPSIERPTSNFCTRSRYDRDRRSNASIRCVPLPCPIFFLPFFPLSSCFDFVMRCFCSILTAIFCALGFIFESELNKFRKGFYRKKAIHLHQLKRSIV